MQKAGISVAPLRTANCGFTVAWSDIFRDKFEGQPLKRIALTFGGITVRGEAVITRDGLEGEHCLPVRHGWRRRQQRVQPLENLFEFFAQAQVTFGIPR